MRYEATHGQHGLWFTERAGVAGTAYHMALAIWFDGELDAAALTRACHAVVERHEPLRSALTEADGALWVVPARTPPPVQRTGYRADLVRDEVTRRFNLDGGPLARFTLAELSPHRHLLLFAAHHTVFDGMSKDILVRELATGYAHGGELPQPAASAAPYAAYAAAERSRVAADTAAAREFWRDRFTDPVDLVLPGLRRTPVTAEPGAVRELALDEGLSGAIERTAQALGLTRFELLLAAVQVLLRRYGNPALPVAVDMSTRTEPVTGHIGLFVNELPVAAPPAGEATFRELARAVRAELREVYRFRSVPLSHAVGSLRPRAAVCPVSLSYRRRAAEEVKFAGLDTTVDWMVFHHAARNALHIQLVDSGTRIDIGLQYPPAAIEPAAVDRIGAHLRTVLESIVTDPDRAATELLPAWPDGEPDRVPATGTGPARAYPPELTVARGFAAQARATPEAVAVVFGPRRVSYRELDEAVARLAGQLRQRGVGASDLVAVCLPRSVETLVAALAVGRAGAAYLPLDPNHPPHRSRLILTEAAPRLLITTSAAAATLGEAVPVVRMDDPALDGTTVDTPPEADPESTAYVIYTSGSTGRPKGVAVPHRAVTNLLMAMRDVLDSGPQDAWLALAALSFDMSVPEYFLPLLVGGRTVIVPEGLVRDGAGLVRLIREQGVTHMQATPSGWRMLLDSGFGTEGERSVVALAGAEALPLPLARELSPRVHRLYNVYGPTETTVWSTLAELPEPVERITIGSPIANTCTHLLDQHGHATTTGELYIGGAGVATGYLHQPELTGQRFLPDPHHGGRMYRTGDLCRREPDGTLTYIGRTDNQVKLRGHRIELGDIEAVLLQYPGIRHAAVTLHGTDNPHLVGYLTTDPPPTEWLRERLPTVMIPTSWVRLDELPLTPNGKLDRAALPDPPPRPLTPPAIPVDHTTEQIRTIWQDVLQIDDIGPDDDLFDLGGHSLTITRIIARIHQQLGVDLPLEVFYDTPTLAEVAAAVRALTPHSA